MLNLKQIGYGQENLTDDILSNFFKMSTCPPSCNIDPITNQCSCLPATTPISAIPTTITPAITASISTPCPSGFTLNPITKACIPSSPVSAQPIINQMQKYVPYLLMGAFGITLFILFKK